MVLYQCDGLEVIKYLFSNPVFTHSMDFCLYCLTDSANGQCVYGDFMSTEFA